MFKRYKHKGFEYVTKGPIAATWKFISELRKGHQAMPSPEMKVRIKKVKPEDKDLPPRSPNHVYVCVPTSYKIDSSSGRTVFKRRWCGRVPSNPQWCAVVHRGMLKGMYQIIQVGDEEIVCSEQMLKPYRPTYLRAAPRDPLRLCRRR
ncbi:MAG: hypothetical protein Q8K86_09110 [Candidatus Nanopelagicaceae bacterium]|nr:hypothetical protein [Candidatus Nanopelagicaceae bacterium]